MQTHLGADAIKRLGQKMGCTHPRLESAKGMFHRLASNTHTVRRLIQTRLHGIKHIFMLPASHSPFGAGRTLSLEITLLAT